MWNILDSPNSGSDLGKHQLVCQFIPALALSYTRTSRQHNTVFIVSKARRLKKRVIPAGVLVLDE